MSDFEAETGAGRRIQQRVLDRGSQRAQQPESGHPSRPKTRYGSIQQHMVDVNGVRKLVLVVDIDEYSRGASSDASPDEYAEWFERWRQQQQREAEVAVSEEPLDESAPLLCPWP
ncbi:uncharacterized protein BDW70DRAFT_139284 [Aspergillus foveolatus]|uniref:uncharacterized protein n=1 Tax=Aspergillus foveolatus TaxID=210207 RepID=UPI003CCDC5F4